MTSAMRIGISVVVLVLVIVVSAYAAWYSYHRHTVIAASEQCQYQLAHPETAPKMRAPDGTMMPVMTPCRIEPVPPTFGELLLGHTAPSDVPEHMQVNPYTFWDALFGRYSVSPDIGAPCDQSATTTDCALLITQQPPAQSQSPGPTIATTTEKASNFTFSYPAGQGRLSEFGAEGVVYPGDYTLVINGITNYDIFVFTTLAPLSSINPSATSLDDYRTDYSISTSTPARMVRILSSENVTINGIPMLRQRYSVGYWTTDQNGQRTFKSDSEADVTDELRYVFFDGKTFVVLTGYQAAGWVDYVAHTIHVE